MYVFQSSLSLMLLSATYVHPPKVLDSKTSRITRLQIDGLSQLWKGGVIENALPGKEGGACGPGMWQGEAVKFVYGTKV